MLESLKMLGQHIVYTSSGFHLKLFAKIYMQIVFESPLLSAQKYKQIFKI